jgi:uncharacterized membrane protein YfhO
MRRFPLISFILTIVILEIGYITRGVFPFGPQSALTVDLYHQYAPFLSELQDKLRSGSSLFYSWSGGLGTDFYSTIAYYLASPLNILVVFSPKSYLTEAVLILILVKVGLCAAFFSVYLEKAYGKKDFTVVAFSLMYSLSGYVLAYSWNIMWLEGIYLMPLVLLGLIRLIRQGRALLYAASLGLLLFSNFYIAFFVAVFTVLYYPILILQFLPKKNLKAIAVKTLQVAAFSLLAVGFAAVVILPTISALKLTSAVDSTFPKDITQYFSLFDYISRHFPAAEPAIREGLPNIYCGLPALMLAPLFFMSRRIPRSEKIAHGALFFFLIMSFNLNVLNYIWHGFHFPNQLPYRYAFVYVFLLVTLSFRALEARDEFSNRFLAGLVCLTAGLVLVAQKLNDNIPGFPDIYLILFALGLYAILFTWRKDNPKSARLFSLFFVSIVAFELIFSTILTMEKIAVNEAFGARSGYLADAEAPELIGKIREIEKKEAGNGEAGFYRMEVMPPKTANDPYLYNYNGITIFSSMMPVNTVTSMQNFGFHTNVVNSYKYEGSTLPLDSLLGVKYSIYRKGPFTEKYKKQIYSSENLSVYENPYAVSIGYMAPGTLKQWNSKGRTPFSAQTSFIENLTGVRDIFTAIEMEEGYSSNADVVRKYGGHFDFTRKDKSQESRISVKLKDTGNRNVYFYFETKPNLVDYGYIMVGDRKIDFNAKRPTLVDAGFCAEDEQVSVELVYKADSEVDGSFSISPNVLEEPKFEEAMQIVAKNSMKVERFDDTMIMGSVDAKKSGVLFTTIPYHKGWSVKVDGEPTDTYAIDEGFLAFDAAKGKHTIQMNYMTPLFPLGAGITAFSILLVLVGVVFRVIKPL